MIILVNPTTGQSVTCSAEAPRFFWAWGIGGEVAVERCAKQYQNLGFVKSDDLKPEQRPISPLAGKAAGSDQRGLNGTFSGALQGNVGSQPFSLRITFTLAESDGYVVGTFVTSAGASGTLSGRVDGTQIAGFRARQVRPCVADFTGAVAVENDGRVLRGTYSGDDCAGPVAASFSASRP
jgi:hypothetical protein